MPGALKIFIWGFGGAGTFGSIFVPDPVSHAEPWSSAGGQAQRIGCVYLLLLISDTADAVGRWALLHRLRREVLFNRAALSEPNVSCRDFRIHFWEYEVVRAFPENFRTAIF